MDQGGGHGRVSNLDGQGRASGLGGHDWRILNRIPKVADLRQNMVAEKLHPLVDDIVGKIADLHVHIQPAHSQFAVRPLDLFDHRIGRAAQDDAFVNRFLDRIRPFTRNRYHAVYKVIEPSS